MKKKPTKPKTKLQLSRKEEDVPLLYNPYNVGGYSSGTTTGTCTFPFLVTSNNTTAQSSTTFGASSWKALSLEAEAVTKTKFTCNET